MCAYLCEIPAAGMRSASQHPVRRRAFAFAKPRPQTRVRPRDTPPSAGVRSASQHPVRRRTSGLAKTLMHEICPLLVKNCTSRGFFACSNHRVGLIGKERPGQNCPFKNRGLSNPRLTQVLTKSRNFPVIPPLTRAAVCRISGQAFPGRALTERGNSLCYTTADTGPARGGLAGVARRLVTNRALWHVRGRPPALRAPRARRNTRSRKSRGPPTRRMDPSECHRAPFVTNLRMRADPC